MGERSLAGKRVVVVGASAGIGRAFAVRAGKEGAKLVVAARRQDRLVEVVAGGRRRFPVTVDIATRVGLSRASPKRPGPAGRNRPVSSSLPGTPR